MLSGSFSTSFDAKDLERKSEVRSEALHQQAWYEVKAGRLLLKGELLYHTPCFHLGLFSPSVYYVFCCVFFVCVCAKKILTFPNAVDLSTIDVILISNYYNILALPFVTEYGSFRGRVYATDPTINIGKLMMQELVYHHFNASMDKDLSLLYQNPVLLQ